MQEKKINNSPCSLSPDTEQLLNQQVGIEATASAIYLAMASWSDSKGYKYAASFLYDQAEEERKHMLKIFHYINDMGGHARQSNIIDIQHAFPSLRKIFELILMQEIQVSQSIHRLVDHCWTNKDFATANFLQWFVEEQIEEETTARRNLELFDVIGDSGVGLFMIEQEIGAKNQTS